MRKLVPIILIVAVVAVAYAVHVRNARRGLRPRGPVVTVSFLDADLGGGVLIRTPEGGFTIVDPGPAAAADELADYLDRLGASKLDVVVSNPSPERAGALGKLLEKFLVRRIVHGEMAGSASAWTSDIEGARARGISELILSSGDCLGLSRSARIEAVSPPKGLLKNKDAGSPENSLVTRLRVGRIRFLLLSDGNAPAEAALLKSGASLESDVLWAAQRGGSRGTCLELIASVRPHYCVVTAGRRLGRPSAALLRRISTENTGATLYRTDRDGTIDFMTDGREITAETRRNGRE